MAFEHMTEYDRRAWERIQDWRESRFGEDRRHYVPRAVRDRVVSMRQAASRRWGDLPASQTIESALAAALSGTNELVQRASDATLDRNGIAREFDRRGLPVSDLVDIRKLDLQDIDAVKPNLRLWYMYGTAAEGAVSGFMVSGGEIVATTGTVASAGAAAAPGALTVAAVIALDAAALLAVMSRAVAHIAAYYGADTRLPEEHLFALSTLNFGTSGPSLKVAAYTQLNKVVQDLVRSASWKQLNSHAVTKVVAAVYRALGMRLVKAKLGQAVPALGILLGAGINARMLARLTEDVEMVYRERFLREKYDLPDMPPTTTLVPYAGEARDDDQAIDIVQLFKDAEQQALHEQEATDDGEAI
jgi:hypothetical protein